MASQSKPRWIEATTTVGDPGDADAAAAAFDTDAAAHVVVEEWPGTRWRIVGYWPDDEAAPARRARLESIVGPVTAATLDDVDWATAWREHHVVIPIGARLEIARPWTTDPTADGRTRIVVEPGAAFGTGAHASTRTCLELLERIGSGGGAGSVLDVGCGSGILAVTALCLGAPSAVACDIAPDAPSATLHTAQRNGVANRITAVHGTIDSIQGRFTRILVNIGGPEAIAHAPRVAERLAPAGIAIVGGILTTERFAVEAALRAANLRIIDHAATDDFVALSCVGA